jgi:hypothetical protein
MFGTVLRTWGAKDSVFVGRVGGAGDWLVDSAAAGEALARGERAGRAVCLVGTAFGFVHLLDSLQARGQRFVLPAGSRVLETGGYKGRSRNVPKADLHGLIGAVLGIAPTQIIGEYGMSELSSQAYDGVARCLAGGGALRQRVFRFPPWARGIVVSPEDGAEVAEGETGLLRVVDLANVRSVMAIQTEDLAVRRGGGFALVGRAAGAEVRGCSLRAAASATDCWVGVG